MRIGIFGGTFDPPHIGHLVVATHIRQKLGLDQVLLVVANDPWQKSEVHLVTAARHRLRMTELATRGYAGIVASDIEISRGGKSYTIDTIEGILGKGDEPLIIVGADAAAGLDSWHRSAELKSAVDVAVVGRPGSRNATPAGWRSHYVEVPQVDVSSTDLRRRVADGSPVDVLIPQRVIDYIGNVELYSPPM